MCCSSLARKRDQISDGPVLQQFGKEGKSPVIATASLSKQDHNNSVTPFGIVSHSSTSVCNNSKAYNRHASFNADDANWVRGQVEKLAHQFQSLRQVEYEHDGLYGGQAFEETEIKVKVRIGVIRDESQLLQCSLKKVSQLLVCCKGPWGHKCAVHLQHSTRIESLIDLSLVLQDGGRNHLIGIIWLQLP